MGALRWLLELFVLGRDDTMEEAEQAEVRHDRIRARYEANLRLTSSERRIAQYETELDKRYGR